MVAGVLEVGGAGSVGIAFESTLGTYVVPTKWIPIRSETLQVAEEKQYRMNLRGKADRTGAIQGYTHVEGDIVFEVTSNYLLYFLYASRVTPTKTGAGPYTYTFVPAHVAKTSTPATPDQTKRKTLSILVQRSQVPMAYTGCSVSQLSFSIDNGVLVCTVTIVGVAESAQTAGVTSFDTSVPFGAGKNTLEIPTGTPRTDADVFSFAINDNAVPANRLNGVRTPAYVNWGEREVTASVEHDFANDTDYQTFVAQTEQVIHWLSSNGANDQVDLLINASIVDSYPVNLSGLGNVVRATISYHGIFDTTDAYLFTVKSSESIIT